MLASALARAGRPALGTALGAARALSSEPAGRRAPVSWAGVALTSLVGGALVGYYNYEKERRQTEASKRVVSTGKPALGGPWTLVDHHGVPRTDADFNQAHTLLYFGFTHCPDICPNELVKLGEAVDRVHAAHGADSLQPLFISVDPRRDTVGQLRAYLKDFHPSLLGLTGTDDQTAAVARAYRVYFSKAYDHDDDSEEEYLVDHSIVMYLVAPDGEFLEFFTQSATAEDVAKKIGEHVSGQA